MAKSWACPVLSQQCLDVDRVTAVCQLLFDLHHPSLQDIGSESSFITACSSFVFLKECRQSQISTRLVGSRATSLFSAKPVWVEMDSFECQNKSMLENAAPVPDLSLSSAGIQARACVSKQQ